MSLLTRLARVFQGQRLNRDIDEELRSHLEDAIAEGRDPQEATRAFGGMLRLREESREYKLIPWLDSLRSDAVFAWRQLWKHKIVSAAAILSLALAGGSCMSAFRLIDALLLRPLPVANADRLYCMMYEYRDDVSGESEWVDSFEYPSFRMMRAAVKDQAELMAISRATPIDLTYSSDDEIEKANRQYVSGWTMGAFGLQPALGRVLTAADDVKPGAHPYVVLSYGYWMRRFGGDRAVLGKSVRIGNDLYEIVGVTPQGFTGTETGRLTDIFLPTMMNAAAIDNPNWGWLRTIVQLKPGADIEIVRSKLRATMLEFRREKAKSMRGSARRMEHFLSAEVRLEPASAGVSVMQRNYRRPLLILGALVGLVLLIACANVANLMLARAASRAREMALRVSIGAGRSRLVQLVLMESGLIAISASALSVLLAWQAAPLVVNMLSEPNQMGGLILSMDWRLFGFAIGLTLLVTFLFGLAPALRASGVRPAAALKGGEDPHAKRRLMKGLVAAQVAFCFVVYFIAGLFVATFEKLSNQPTGFNSEGLLTLETNAKGPQPITRWEETLQHLRSQTGVESAAICGWALLSGNGWSGGVWVNGQSAGEMLPYFLGVSPGWFDTMQIPMRDGRDFRAEESAGQTAIVNEAFAARYFEGRNPVGSTIEVDGRDGKRNSIHVVGYVKDAKYRDMREPIRPTVYVPFRRLNDKGEQEKKDWATFIVRTRDSNPYKLADTLRREVKHARTELRVSDLRSQADLVRSHTIKERLLAALSVFFAAVALALSAVGLYGVMDYAVLQRRRELGIRIALGARMDNITGLVMNEVLLMLAVGSVIGLAAGMASERFVGKLLFGVKPTDLSMLLTPTVTMLFIAVLASLPPIVRALRTDTTRMLRAE